MCPVSASTTKRPKASSRYALGRPTPAPTDSPAGSRDSIVNNCKRGDLARSGTSAKVGFRESQMGVRGPPSSTYCRTRGSSLTGKTEARPSSPYSEAAPCLPAAQHHDSAGRHVPRRLPGRRHRRRRYDRGRPGDRPGAGAGPIRRGPFEGPRPLYCASSTRRNSRSTTTQVMRQRFGVDVVLEKGGDWTQGTPAVC
jgi:hypothetical protein